MSDTPRILIVDDEPRITESLKKLLSESQWIIHTANSGSEALDCVKNTSFDCVLLDLVLPEYDGFEIMKYIKEKSPDTKIIIVTGFATIDSAVDCLKLGAHDYLKKPINHDELVKRIENALDLKRLKEEKELIQSKLLVSEDRYQYLVNSSPDIIYTLNRDGTFSFINESVKSLLRYDNEKLIGKHYTRIIHPDDQEKAKNIFNERRSNCRGMSCTELRLLSNQEAQESSNLVNGLIIVELKAKGIYDRPNQQGGKVFLGTYGVAQDITVRKRYENELEIQKAHFQQLFENSPEAIAILDDRDRVINLNKGFEQLFGYSLEECLNHPISDLIVPEELREEATGLSQTVLSKGIAQQTESVRKHKDGHIIDVALLGYPMQLDDNNFGIYAIYSDITLRKRSEETIKNTLSKLRKAMGGIIYVIVSTVEARDPYTAGHQQRVAELARSIAQEMGLSLEEVDGIRIAGSIHDLGKIKIPAEILSNPGKITEAEFNLIKTHPEVAFGILDEIEFSRPVAEIVYQHHEKIDGSGYPRGLTDKDILLEAKILTVADVVEAIASHRPYRPALGVEKALDEITLKKGIQYDPEAVDACIRLFEKKEFNF